MKCIKCGKETRNPKYCSRSCSVSFNNLGVRRHGEEPRNCIICKTRLNRSQAIFCSHKCEQECKWDQRKRKYLEEGVIQDPKQRRKYLLERDGNRCEICGLSEWNDKEIPLVADHIDGNPENHQIDNLRLICCNCDAQLPTYKSRNTGNGRAYRRKRYQEGKSY